MPQVRIPTLLWLALPICAALSCASGRGAERDPQLEELRGQLFSQADQLKQQQQRIEALELRLAAVAARPPAPAPAKAVPPEQTLPPVQIDNTNTPPKALQTVKLNPHKSGRVVRRLPRRNPVEQAPRLPATVELKEPDDERLAELEKPQPRVDPTIRDQLAADQAFAQAIQQLNAGDYLSAQTAFISFAAHWPRNSSADDAVYYAGLARAASGDCKGALPQFERVMRDYPAGNARVPALFEKGRCLLLLGRHDEGRKTLEKLIEDDDRGLEAQQAKALLATDAASTEAAQHN